MSAPGWFEVRDLSLVRGDRLLFDGIGFGLARGEAMLLRGPNGSGKSSLLRLVAGLVPAFTGTLDWTGAPGSIAYLGHQDAVKPALTPRETLRFWGAAAGAAPDAAAIDAALAAVGLDGLDDLPCRYLSAGQQRRMAMAKLLVAWRPVWLLDEPTAALDRQSDALFAGIMKDHLAGGGIIVAATHQELGLEDAKRLEMTGFEYVY